MKQNAEELDVGTLLQRLPKRRMHSLYKKDALIQAKLALIQEKDTVIQEKDKLESEANTLFIRILKQYAKLPML
jgi:hypothetical protein